MQLVSRLISRTRAARVPKYQRERQELVMRRKQILLSVTLLIVTIGTLLVLASGRLSGRTRVPSPTAGPTGIQYIRCSRLRTGLCDALKVLGSRLQVPGKERLTITGSLTRTLPGGVTDVVTVRVITEFPHLMRIEEQRLGQVRVVGFDGQQAWTNLGVVTPPDLDLVESIAFDSADSFFVGQTQGAATRFLGSRFRLDDGKDPNYTGPFYDIYQAVDQVNMGARSSFRPKLYYFNSDNLRIERVRYQLQRATLPVAVQLSTPTWHTVDNQLVPNSIERFENGSSVWKLTGATWTLSPRADDGTFTRPTLP